MRVLGYVFQITFELRQGNVDGAWDGFFFKIGRRPNIDDHHRAGIELLLELIGWGLFGADGPFRFWIYLISALFLSEGSHSKE